MIPIDNDEAVEIHEKKYFDCKVIVWKIKGPYWGNFPWRYSVEHKDKKRNFSGVPNYLESKASALKKAWWRAKWLSEGTFEQRYR